MLRTSMFQPKWQDIDILSFLQRKEGGDTGSSGLGSGPWAGTLCCVLGQDTLVSRCLSPPRCINGYRRNAGGNPAMD